MRMLYCLSNCRGSKLAEQFLTKHQFDYTKKNLSYARFTEVELLNLDQLIPGGVADLVNPYSSHLAALNVNYKSLTKRDLIDLIVKNPQILSYPILLQTNGKLEPRKLVVGFNDYEWMIFEKEVKTSRYYNNLNKLYKFNSCCCFDEVDMEINNKKIQAKNEQ